MAQTEFLGLPEREKWAKGRKALPFFFGLVAGRFRFLENCRKFSWSGLRRVPLFFSRFFTQKKFSHNDGHTDRFLFSGLHFLDARICRVPFGVQASRGIQFVTETIAGLRKLTENFVATLITLVWFTADHVSCTRNTWSGIKNGNLLFRFLFAEATFAWLRQQRYESRIWSYSGQFQVSCFLP